MKHDPMILTILFENNTSGRCIAADHSIAALAWRHEVVMHQMHLSYLLCCHWPIPTKAYSRSHLSSGMPRCSVCSLFSHPPCSWTSSASWKPASWFGCKKAASKLIGVLCLTKNHANDWNDWNDWNDIPTSRSKQLQLKALLHCESIALVLGVSETIHCLKHLGGFGASNWKDRSWMIMIDSDSQLFPIALVSF